jgi:chitodextrinase
MRDSIDQRAINDFNNGTGRAPASSVSAYGGYPVYNTATPYPDADKDGMSDTWEASHGLSSTNAADRNDTASNGYTHLENFLNELAGDSIAGVYGGGTPTPTPTATPTPTPAEGPMAQYAFENNTNDTSGNGNNGTAVGSPTYSAGKIGQAINLNGSSQSVDIGSRPSLNMGANVTVAVWVWTNTTHLGTIVRHGDINTSPYVDYGLVKDNGVISGAGKLCFQIGTTAGIRNLCSTAAVSDNAWHHVAGTWNGATMQLYIDGALNTSMAESGTPANVNDTTTIGRNQSFGEYFNGKLDDLRIYNRALTGSEIQSLANPDTQAPTTPTNLTATAISSTQINLSWSASTDNVGVTGYKVFRGGTQIASPTGTTYSDTGLTANTSYTYTVSAVDAANNESAQSSPASATTQAAPSLAAEYKFDSSATDSSGNNNNLTLVNAPTYTTGQVNQALSLNGTNQYAVTTSYSPTLNLTGTAMTLAGWVKPTTQATSIIVAKPYASTHSAPYFDWGLIYNAGGNGKPSAYLGCQGSHQYANTALTLNSWQHIAVTYDGANLRFYRNGVADGVIPATCAVTNTNSQNMRVGANANGTETFPGALDEVKIYNRALSQTEVSALANPVTNQPPTVTMTSPANGATVSGSVTVSANATDDVGVAGVQFLFDGGNFGPEDTTSPYSMQWDTTFSTTGSHTLSARARDSAGLTTTATPVTVTVVRADTTAPVITAGPSHTNVTSQGATITWTTDEPSTSQVEYGTSISYGSSTTLDSTLVTSHSASLASLSPNTTYHYRVKSKDAANNEVVSSDITFTTLPPPDTTPPVRSMGAPTGTLPAGTRTSTLSLATNEAATCKYSTVAGVSYDSMTNTFTTTGGTSHSQALSNLADGQSYSYTVRCADAVANKNPDDYTISFSVANPSPDTTAPTIPSGGSAQSTTDSSMNLTWSGSTDPVITGQITSGLAGYRIYRCQGSGCTPSGTPIASQTGTTYTDTNLTRNTTYGYAVASYDTAGNESTKSTTFYGTTLADTTAPTITTVNVINISANAATITWSTNEPSDSTVLYGTSPTKLNLTASDAAMVTGHAVNLTNLSKKTTYYFKVQSKDAANNTATSPATGTNSFRTNPGGGVISLQASNGSVKLAWAPISDPDVTQIVIYRSTSGYPEASGQPLTTLPANATNYRDTDVTAGTTYYYSVYTKDGAGDLSDPSNISYTAGAEHGNGGGGGTVTIRLTKVLSTPMRGEEVKSLQEFLIANNYLNAGDNSGYFGLKTFGAVKRFQCDQNIVCTGTSKTTGWGMVGPQTRLRINSLSGGAAPTADEQSQIQALIAQIAALQALLAQAQAAQH